VRERFDRMVLRGIDLVVRRAVDNRIRPGQLDRASDCPIVSDIDLVARERDDVVALRRGREIMHDGGTQLSASANNDDSHDQATFARRSCANACIRSSSSTPSHRATTAVAMQLPITFTAVRPMSMI